MLGVKKILITALTLLLVTTSVGIYFFGDDSPKDPTYDTKGNLVNYESTPYYGYLEQLDISSDESIRECVDGMYISEDNPDYLVSAYDDGICINKYLGTEKSVIIPEKIDGKSVVKLGNYYMEIEGYYSDYTAFWATGVESVCLPSGLKEIVHGTFWQTNSPELYWNDGICDPQEIEYTLKSITVSKDNPYYVSVGGTLFSRTSYKVLCSPPLSYY